MPKMPYRLYSCSINSIINIMKSQSNEISNNNNFVQAGVTVFNSRLYFCCSRGEIHSIVATLQFICCSHILGELNPPSPKLFEIIK